MDSPAFIIEKCGVQNYRAKKRPPFGGHVGFILWNHSMIRVFLDYVFLELSSLILSSLSGSSLSSFQSFEKKRPFTNPM